MERSVAHFDLDAFFVSVECKNNSALKGKPLIVGGGERGVAAACSYEARKFGVHSAMPMRMAKQLCPQAIVIGGDYEAYSKHSRLVTEVIASKVPLYEKASIDEFYVDMTGMDKFFGNARLVAELKQLVLKETGLPISYALAGNKLISKVATNEVKPNGAIQVYHGTEKAYLAPLAIEKMPGIGPKRSALLRDLEVTTIAALANIPKYMLEKMFGKEGHDLWRKANGIDETPVIPYTEQKSISTQDTFTNDTIDMRFLEAQLVRMTEKIGFELRQQNKQAGCITVKIRYSDFNTVTKSHTIAYTSADAVLLKTAKELFHKLYDRRLLVRLLGISFTDLVAGNYQINLFSDKESSIKLYQAIDSIKNQFGSGAIMRARGLRK
ncbi:DNA polymerase IV [Chitinophaga pinensis]|uniref:DNA polymerase IV n=1 Tax=Chitinophaga pinensis (strain ATCC 43595 / DSM 2588 / LMG 13176 / NBRC 15968 / NCIMB 11800 / UQM 2034) TaxID=485918 RepID=A0A979G4A4_CHIPD|nr:DNA polymerase IV [Chitinophaga pinensis]ACU60702.1 DNA-directed DNA polymerase [Chitinophaga pinensis DSM 2588]